MKSINRWDIIPININEDCQFMKDLSDTSSNVNRGMYNLICSKRDLKLYVKGIKPHRYWKITQVKEYFGMNGKPEVFLRKLITLYDILTEKGEQNENE